MGFISQCSHAAGRYWQHPVGMVKLHMVSGLNLMLVFYHERKGWTSSAFLLFSDYNVDIPGLVNVYITMENHHFSWEKPLFLWPFLIAMLNYQRINQYMITIFSDPLKHPISTYLDISEAIECAKCSMPAGCTGDIIGIKGAYWLVVCGYIYIYIFFILHINYTSIILWVQYVKNDVLFYIYSPALYCIMYCIALYSYPLEI